jgi:hypothetical protein
MRATHSPTAPVPTRAVGHPFPNVKPIQDTDMLCGTGHKVPLNHAGSSQGENKLKAVQNPRYADQIPPKLWVVVAVLILLV